MKSTFWYFCYLWYLMVLDGIILYWMVLDGAKWHEIVLI